MEKGAKHSVFLFSSACEYRAPGSALHAGGVSWAKSLVSLLGL